ncbi:MAG: methyl-accepting chemotaxis protein [Eubacteriales bacterium]
MKWFYDMKISAKLLTGFIIVALLAATVGAIGYSGMSQVKKAQDEGATIYLPSIQALLTMSEAQTAVDSAENALLNEELVGQDRQAQYDRITAFLKRAEEARAIYEPLPQSADEKVVWDKFVPAWDKWIADDAQFQKLSKQFETSKSLAFHSEMVKQALVTNGVSFNNAETLLMQVVAINQGNAKSADSNADSAAKTATTLLIMIIVIAFLISIGLGLLLSRIISKPLKKTANMIQEMKMGHLGLRLNMKTKDEIGQMAVAMDDFADDLQNVVIATMKKISLGDVTSVITLKDEKDEISPALIQTNEAIKGLIAEAGMLSVAAVEGRLDTRGNAAVFSGGYKDIVEGVNKTLDAVIGPLNVAAEYVDRISKGDMPPKISDSYNGDFNEIKNNLNTCIDAVNALVEDAVLLSVAAVEGRLDTRADAGKHAGDFARIVDGVNKTLDAVIGPLNVAAEYVDRISKGDMPPKISDSYNGDFNEIKNNLNTCIDAVNALVEDAVLLSVAAVEGRLDTRADASKHAGDFARIVDGVNKTLDAVIGPLNVAAEYVDRISKGDMPPKISDSYNGDFNEIKNNLNTCIDAVNALVEDAVLLSVAAVEGRLDTRADASKHAGDFARIVDGVNKTLDAVIGPLNVAAEYVDRISKGDMPPKISDSYNGDFNEIKNNLNTCIDAVNALVEDAGMLAVAAVEGRLDTRADASKHEGDFAKIVKGVNSTLDAVIGPVKEALSVLTEMSKGNLSISMNGDYKGDYAQIKVTLNDTISTILSYVSEISQVLTAMADGDLQQAITADYRGDFIDIKNSLNNIIGSLNDVLGDINDASDQVASGSKQVSDGSQALSQGSTEQASSIEELTASIVEIATQTKQNAMNANQANELATTAKDNAASGNEQMKEMLNSMKEINASSANISKIIKVIDEIAFQTNILALNAAVEAARAGQHGKGFAVVAEEVRNLAARSANAAKETTDLIEGSITKVQVGTKIANDTAVALVEIVNDVEKAAKLVGQIAEASNEQATGIAEVNKGIEQVSQVIQNNSATAEESAAASEELSGQAELLKEMVSRFRLKKSSKSNSGREQKMISGARDNDTPKAGRPKILLSQDEADKY